MLINSLRNLGRKIKLIGNDFYDAALIKYWKSLELKKYNDAQSIKLYSHTLLTESQQKSIDSFYLTNYGEKIPYTWHRVYTAFSGNFDVTYFPELLYGPEFEYFMNRDIAYVEAFADKNVVPLFAAGIGIKTPKTILSCVKGAYRDADNVMLAKEQALAFIADYGKVFIKPAVGASSGRGCAILNLHAGIDELSGKSIEEMVCALEPDFVIQECIKCHPSVAALHEQSVNTFRVVTYRWKDRIEHVPSFLRMGIGENFVDNAHAGGIFIAIDDDGKLHERAFTEFNEQYTEHPDSHIIFAGYSILLFKEVLATAERMHMAIPQLGVVNWDFTLDEAGNPLLLEANTRWGGIWAIQISHGCGLFGDKTAEILRWLREMKSKKLSERGYAEMP